MSATTATPAAPAGPLPPAFRERFPEYDAPAIDRLRATEYARLDAQGQVYLDYTGGSLYAAGQLREHLDLLAGGVFGNPHSASPTSLAATALAEGARRAVLAHFNAAPEEYSAVFTLNASGAIKLVGEAYPFAPGSTCLLTADNHNSVNGLRELVRAKGARTVYVDVRLPELTVPEAALQRRLEAPAAPGTARLFAYPAQSNFSGAQHPLDWIARARALGWDVLLDAAAFAPTNRLDLGRWHPDFVAVSFYKLFGYPTGIGCLIARKAALKRLRRPWFAGGTVTMASVRTARPPPRRRPGGVRRRHHQLPRAAGGDGRPAPPGGGRARRRPRPRAGADRLAAGRPAGPAPQQRPRRSSASTDRPPPPGAAPPSPSTCSPRPAP